MMFKEPWCPIACNNLLEILDRCPDVRIVISSSWRVNMKEVEDHFLEAGLPWDRVIGKTPRLPSINSDGRINERGHEIEAWLLEHATEGHVMMPEYSVEDFVILDDSSDMAPYKETHWYETDWDVGLSWPTVLQILQRFNSLAKKELEEIG